MLLKSGDGSGSAERATVVLGQLRGLATKLGQMASYVDGVVPEHHAEAYGAAMTKLQAATPTSDPVAVQRLVEAELGAPLTDLYSEWEPTPIASASIGQVHRATLLDGTPVAVKVQHPGITEALEADLSNAGLIEMALGMMGTRKFESKRLLEELRERFREELDYTLEARRQTEFRALHEGNPKIHIPRIIEACSTHRVLTSEFVTGLPFAEAREASEDERRAWAETLWSFVYGSNLMGGLFNADPHPGNYIFGPEGHVSFLDFGCIQPIAPKRLAAAHKMHRAANIGDREAHRIGTIEMLELRGGRYEELAVKYVGEAFRPLFDSPYRITRAWTATLVEGFKEMAFELRRTKKDHFVPLPDGILFMNRLQFGFYSVLARLDVAADYRSVEREILQKC